MTRQDEGRKTAGKTAEKTAERAGGRIRERILSAVYPRRCPLCDGILSGGEPFLCRKCAGKVRFIRGPVCMKCGAPLAEQQEYGAESREDQASDRGFREGQERGADFRKEKNSGQGCREILLPEESAEFCPKCKAVPHAFVQGFAPFLYRGEIRQSLMRLKYGNRAEYARFFGKALAVYGQPWLEQWNVQLLVPVPVHPSRERRRGYNQAAEIARVLGKEIHVPVEEDGVCRVKNTKPQKELTGRMRRRNLQGAFQVRAGTRMPARVLIVDDIFTTGATVDELARTLYESGAQEVYAACASMD
ncbi:ComF family protein [Bilifractor porci]|uniref:ComF family protein n=1 Tax=Bilifractor porci TaxID=2606636 RepID=A0A7X2TNG6_9FIRM|nr:ComF family protein [Bilifractor porci]